MSLGFVFFQKSAFTTDGSLFSLENTFGFPNSEATDTPEIEMMDNDGAFLADNDGVQLLDNV